MIDSTSSCRRTHDPQNWHAAAGRTAPRPLSLLRRDALPTTVLVCLLWLLAQLGSGWATWAPDIAAVRGVPRGATLSILAASRVLAFLAFVVAAVAVRARPKAAAILATVATAAASAALTVVVARARTTTTLTFGGAYCAFVLAYAVVWPIMYAITPPHFATDARALGVGLATMSSKVGALVGPFLVSSFIDDSIFLVGALFTSGWFATVTVLAGLAAAGRQGPSLAAEATQRAVV